METEIKTTGKTLLERIAEKLVKTQQEVDELALQLALGKAEAKDKFEEIKKELKTQVSNLKRTFMTTALNELMTTLKTKFEELELQLALGKADSADAFEAQSKKILHSLKSLEHEIKSKLTDHPEANTFGQDVEKFKLKLEILRLRFILKKFEVKDTFKEKMNAARKVVDQLKQSANEKVLEGKHSINDFKEEMELTYKHLRQAIESFTKK